MLCVFMKFLCIMDVYMFREGIYIENLSMFRMGVYIENVYIIGNECIVNIRVYNW